jgi:hypothetical protein
MRKAKQSLPSSAMELYLHALLRPSLHFDGAVLKHGVYGLFCFFFLLI